MESRPGITYEELEKAAKDLCIQYENIPLSCCGLGMFSYKPSMPLNSLTQAFKHFNPTKITQGIITLAERLRSYKDTKNALYILDLASNSGLKHHQYGSSLLSQTCLNKLNSCTSSMLVSHEELKSDAEKKEKRRGQKHY